MPFNKITLLKGAFHDACKLDNQGLITRDTAKTLMVIVSYLFGRLPFNKLFYELNKDKLHNSKVLLPDLPNNVVKLLEEFNDFLDSSFENYMRAAGQIFPKDRDNTILPISNRNFNIEKDPGVAFNQVSPFAVLAGVSNRKIDKNQIRILGSNIRPELLTDIIPKIDTNRNINSYALDFYNHGGY